jgi:hypothetical protein
VPDEHETSFSELLVVPAGSGTVLSVQLVPFHTTLTAASLVPL